MKTLEETLFPKETTWKEINLSNLKETIHRLRSAGKDWQTELENQYHARLKGGWMENRSPFFDHRHVPTSTIHLGIDYWLPANTPIVCPVPGKILLARPKNSEAGGWGGRIDLLHQNHVWIFGHLKTPNPTQKTFEAGETLGHLAPREENGGWKPHLHLQIMEAQAYLALPNPSELDAYASPNPNLPNLFPNPEEIFQKKEETLKA